MAAPCSLVLGESAMRGAVGGQPPAAAPLGPHDEAVFSRSVLGQ